MLFGQDLDLQPKLRIGLLGEFVMLVDDRLCTSVNTPRLQALVAYLLLHRDAPQPRRQIAFLFWPDSSEGQALTNLRKLLYDLRLALPDAEAYITLDRHTVFWTTSSPYPFAVDVDAFKANLTRSDADAGDIEALQQAIDLYGGDLLPHCYDEWIVGPREQLRGIYLAALGRLIDLLEQRGQLTRAVVYARRLISHDPLLEENYRRLMQLYLAMGDRASVHNVFKQCALMMRREFGIEPGQATFDIKLRSDALKKEASRTGLAGDRSTRKAPPRLPAQTTAFFGREQELLDISSLIHERHARVVTLTGTAGTGKTRLGIESAWRLAGAFPEGACFVSLAGLAEPQGTRIVEAIASALGVADSLRGDPAESLHRAIGSKHILLVLDNFEHLLPESGTISALLAACPELTILATSRAPLNIQGEHEYPVSPLRVPPREVPARLEELARYESVALFVDRVLEVAPRLELSAANLSAAADICRRLEGLPLSVELAAARAKVLPLPAILSRLNRRLKLLVGGRRDLPERQQSLQTAIAWSYDLLDPNEKALFRLLGVFSGTFSLDAVAAVAGYGDLAECLDLLLSLADKSLLTRAAELGEGEPRFGMLETLKEYAWEMLVEREEAQAAVRKHILYFTDVAGQADSHLEKSEYQLWTARLEVEHENMRAALRRALDTEPVDTGAALRMVAGLCAFWVARGYFDEGLSWIEEAATLPATDNEAQLAVYRGIALSTGGLIAERQGKYELAGKMHANSVAILETSNDRKALADALNNQALLAATGGYEQAIQLHLRSLSLRREIGYLRGTAQSLINLGHVNMQRREYEQGQLYAEEALPLARQTRDSILLSGVLYVLGMVALETGDLFRAAAYLQEGSDLARTDGNQWLTARIRMGHGQALYAIGEYERSMQAYTEAEVLYIELGDRWGAGLAHGSFGREAHRKGDLLQAARKYKRALQTGLEIKDGFLCGCSLGGLAGLLAETGRASDAALLYGFAERAAGEPLARYGLTLGMDKARAQLGSQWEATYSNGAAMSAPEALALAATVSAEANP